MFTSVSLSIFVHLHNFTTAPAPHGELTGKGCSYDHSGDGLQGNSQKLVQCCVTCVTRASPAPRCAHCRTVGSCTDPLNSLWGVGEIERENEQREREGGGRE